LGRCVGYGQLGRDKSRSEFFEASKNVQLCAGRSRWSEFFEASKNVQLWVGMRHRSDIHGSVGTTGRGSTSVRNSEGVQIGHTWECRYDRTWFDFWVRERDQKLTHK